MANQIVVSSGAKVRDLNDVIIGTSGVLSSLAFNVSNGVPKLDVNGKILVSQLPNSVMEYLGTWNAATNTPFLVNGTGNAGDVYLCNVAGTVDFGAGPITFVVSDQVIYSGSIWQKASGSNGTVTSVAVTESGDSLNITGSPITTSGTINIGFNGTNLQYINGAGDLTTFPTLLSSVGLSMPSAFNVSNSPLTANGTIGVTGAGNASQYIRGDGTLAAYNPSTGGGGSSVSYYLNGGTNQGTFVGNTYYEMSKTAVIGTGVDFTINANGYISQFITDANDPAQLVIPAGNWNFEMYFSASSSGGSPSFYVELYKYNGSTFTLIADNSANPEYITNGTAIDLYTTAVAVPETSLTITDRLAIRVYVIHASKTITLHTQDSHLCQVITTFSTGITALNGLTAQVQYFATGTSGTDFAINSSTATHTFNLPIASASNTGKLSSTDWSTFNNKQATISLTTTGTSGAATLVGATLNIPNYGSALSGYLPLSGGTLTGLLNGTSADFSSSVSALELLLDSAGTASATFVKNTNGTGVISTGSNQIGFNLNNAFFITSDNKGCSIFSFNHSSSAYTYTLPSANGTIALVGGSGVGTVTSVAALTLGTTGTDLSSSVANGTTTPVITLNVPTASATNRGALSSADWTTFNNKASTADLANYLPLAGGTLTGALNGTSAVFSSTVQASAYRLTGMTGGSGALYWTSDRVTLANYNATGVVNIEANGGTSVATFGGATYNNDFVGTGRFTGIVTFGSTLSNGTYAYTLPSATGTLALTSSLSSYLPLSAGTGNKLTGDLYINKANSALVFQGNTTDALIYNTGSNLLLVDNATGTKGLTLNVSTGAATFSNSVTATQLISASGSNKTFSTNITPLYTPSDYSSLGGSLGVSRTSDNRTDLMTFYMYNTSASGENLAITSREDIVLYGNGREYTRFKSNGNVLIGTTSDTGYALNIVQSANSALLALSNGGRYTEIDIKNSGTNKVELYWDNTNLRWYNHLNVGTGAYLSGGAWTSESDIRLKDIIEPITNAIDKVNLLNGVIGKYKYEEEGIRRPFLIAQDVEKALPEAVSLSTIGKDGNEEYLHVAYTQIIPLLVESIKELSKQNEELSNRLIKLESK